MRLLAEIWPRASKSAFAGKSILQLSLIQFNVSDNHNGGWLGAVEVCVFSSKAHNTRLADVRWLKKQLL